MEIKIEVIKNVIGNIQNTIFPEDQEHLTIPILLDDFTDLHYDNETVRTYNLHFRRIKGIWHIEL